MLRASNSGEGDSMADASDDAEVGGAEVPQPVTPAETSGNKTAASMPRGAVRKGIAGLVVVLILACSLVASLVGSVHLFKVHNLAFGVVGSSPLVTRMGPRVPPGCPPQTLSFPFPPPSYWPEQSRSTAAAIHQPGSPCPIGPSGLYYCLTLIRTSRHGPGIRGNEAGPIRSDPVARGMIHADLVGSRRGPPVL